MNMLEVKTGKTHIVLIVLLGIFFVPAGLAVMFTGARGSMLPLVIGVMCLAVFGALVWLNLHAFRKTAKHFTNEGVTRNDGRQFAWTDLSGVVNQFRGSTASHHRRKLWRTEIRFKDGDSAWLIPSKVSNYQEVSEYVNNLPCKHTEVNV